MNALYEAVEHFEHMLEGYQSELISGHRRRLIHLMNTKCKCGGQCRSRHV